MPVRIVLAMLLLSLCPVVFSEGALVLHTRGQIPTTEWVAPEKVNTDLEAPVSGRPFTFVHKTMHWLPEKTALVIVDLWDQAQAPVIANRMDELAPGIDEVARAARAKGILIVHAPGGVTDYYTDSPQRARCRDAEPVALVALGERPALPVDASDNGWEGPIRADQPQTRQHAAIEIAPEDAIGEGAEVYGLLRQRGIENVILTGVHANFSLLDGPTGIRQMKAQGLNVVLMRDLTDSRYNPEKAPRVNHVRGTELVVDYVEQLGCPTVESTDLTGAPAFRFAEDKRPHLAMIVSDDHYHADKTLPEFARVLRESAGLHVTVLHGEGGHSIPGMENLAAADAVLVFVRRLGLPAQQLRQLRDFVASGKSVIGLRTASHAFKLKNKPDGTYEIPEGTAEWGAFDAEVLGGSYTGHEANELGADIRNLAVDHPILKGVQPAAWHSAGSLYNTGATAPDALRLQEGSIPGVTEAVTWIREATPGRGKVFYTSLGHPADFSEPAFRQLLLNGIKWSVGTL